MRSTIVAALAAVALPFVAAQQAYDYATTVNTVAAAGRVVIVVSVALNTNTRIQHV